MIDEQELAEFILSIIESPQLQIPANHAGVMVEAQAWMRGFTVGSQRLPESPRDLAGHILSGLESVPVPDETESSQGVS